MNSFYFHRVCVDLTTVLATVVVPYMVYFKVPAPLRWSMYTDPFVVDDNGVLFTEQDTFRVHPYDLEIETDEDNSRFRTLEWSSLSI